MLTITDLAKISYLFSFLVIVIVGVTYVKTGDKWNFKFQIHKNQSTNLHLDAMKQSNMFLKQNISQENETKAICQECDRHVPNVLIQYGPGRTASTLQFQILCLMMIMLHEDEASSIGCYFHRKPSHKYSVIKTHDRKFLLQSLPRDAWIFMTSRSQLPSELKRKEETLNRTLKYIVDIGMVARKGHFIAYDYQSIFGISDKQMSDVVSYLRFWDILRRCCGKQMSSDWRNRLSPIPNYSKHYDSRDTLYPACEMYNISEVETLFINTYIYKRYTPINSLRDTIGKPSTVDGTLNGHYCERCNKNITARHLHGLNNKCA